MLYRFHLKKLVLLFVVIGAVITGLCGKDIIIAESGNANAQIVIDETQATEVEKKAAQELKQYLEQMSGAKFQIVTPESANKKGIRFLIGRSAEISQLLPQVDFDSLKGDSIIIKSVNNKDFILSGARPRGTIFAVYALLEDTLNCNFWTPTESDIPRVAKLALPDNLNTMYTPKITNRALWFRYLHPLTGPFGAMLKLNGSLPRTAKIYGGYRDNMKGGHSFHFFLPPEKYFDSHPEWYNEVAGKRFAFMPAGAAAQLCLSNHEMLLEFIQQVKIKLDEMPSYVVVSISQEDGTPPCVCSECQKSDAQFGGPTGTLLNFVNQVAAGLEKSHPNILVQTLAYQYSVRPPTKPFKCHQNVEVLISTINEDYGVPWNHKRNENFNDLITGWQKCTNKIGIYDYPVNYHMPVINSPYWDSMAANIRYYLKNNVSSVVYEADHCNHDGSFNQLRGYLLGHLLWNPDLDFDKLLERFLNGYYGHAGPYLNKYIKLSARAARENTACLPLWSDDPAFLSTEEFLQAKSLIDLAEKAVAGDGIKNDRLKSIRASFELQLLLSCNLSEELRNHFSQEERDEMAKKFIEYALSGNNEFFAYEKPVKLEDFDYLTGRSKRTINGIQLASDTTSAPPKIVKIKKHHYSELQETQFQINSKACEIISDPTASNAVAVRVPSDAGGWAICGVPFSKDCRMGKADLYISAKINTTERNHKPILAIKVYNLRTGQNDLIREIKNNEFTNGEYSEIKIGQLQPYECQYFTLSPYAEAESGVKDIVVDRFFLIKAK